MKVVFAGTPAFAALALRHVLQAGFEVPLVWTQPDRPAGRGMKLQASPVKQVALEHGLALSQPSGLRLDGRYAAEAQAAQAALQAAQPDVMVVVAYGLILPPWVLQQPVRGCLNIHASLLPRWRGAAPIHRAIEAGDSHSGVTIMQMDEGLDTGDMLLWEAQAIHPEDTTATLHDRLAELGARLVVQALQQLPLGVLHPQPQPEAGVTYAHKIDKEEAWIDWRQPAAVLQRRLRAFDPFPGAVTVWRGEAIKLWAGQVQPATDLQAPAAPGTLLGADAAGVRVQTGEGVLCLTQLQRPGGRRLPAREFLRGTPLQPGERLGQPEGACS